MAAGERSAVYAALQPDAPEWLRTYVLGYVRGVLAGHPHNIGTIAGELGVTRRTFERLRSQVAEIRDDPRAWGKSA
jgi:hypothetical protein